jgi:PAS domain S-box-containing protein
MNESHPGGAIRSRSAFQPQVFGLLFEAHPHAMLVVDPETHEILIANPSAGGLLGRPHLELIGKSVEELKASHVSSALPRGRAVRPEEVCRGGIWRFARGPEDILLEIVSTEIEVDGKPALLVVATDVTRREAVMRLQSNRERLLSEAIDNLPGCIIAIDQHGLIIEFNAAAEKAFNRRRQDVLNHDMADLIVPAEHRERHRRGLAHYLETGERHVIGRPFEMRAMRSDGSLFWVEILVSVAHLDGNETVFVAHFRDLTESKREQRQLAIHRALSAVLAEDGSVPDTTRSILRAVCEHGGWDVGLAWMMDGSGAQLRYADSWHSRDEVKNFVERSSELSFPLGKGLPGRVWEKRAQHWVPDISVDPNFPRSLAAVQGGIRSGFAFPVRADHRVIGVIEFFSRERRESDQELIDTFDGVGQRLGHFIERKHKAEKLREANDMLRALLRASPLAIIQIDRQLIVRFWNAAAERMFGWSEKEILGRPYPVLVPADKRNEFKKLCDRLFAGEELRGIDTWRKHKDGSRVDIHLNVAPLRDKDGEITSLLGVIAASPKPKPPGPRIQKS